MNPLFLVLIILFFLRTNVAKPKSAINLTGDEKRNHCAVRNMFNGVWEYSGVQESSSFDLCKETHNFIKRMPNNISRQLKDYSCRAYEEALFQPFDCHMMSLRRSLLYVEKWLTNSTITYIGDSLMIQQFIAIQCDLEINGLLSTTSLKWDYIWDQFLRPVSLGMVLL